MQPCSSAVMVLRPPPQTTCEQRRVVVSWKNYSCEQAAGWPEPEGQSPSRWDVTDLHITTVWETVRKCQALFVTQHFHFTHKWPPGKAGARDVSPVWPLSWTLPLYQRSPGSPRGLHQVLREKHSVREPLFRKVTLISGTHDREMANVSDKTELCPGSWGSNKTVRSVPHPRQPQGPVLPGGLALTWPWTTGQVTHVWIRQTVQTILIV